MEESEYRHCEQILGYTFRDQLLLKQALTHSSLAQTRVHSNERMEFLGDAVLGLVICEKLYLDHEHFLEGDMTKIKSAVVSRRMCAEVSDDIGITEMLRLGKGVGDRSRPQSMAAAVLESIIGAIYIDGGMEPAREFIIKHMSSKIQAVIDNEHSQNYKSMLQQHVQQLWCTTPYYELLDEKGPDHSKAFEICVVIRGRRFPSAWGNNKKDAEQLAARLALEELDLIEREQEVEGACD